MKSEIGITFTPTDQETDIVQDIDSGLYYHSSDEKYQDQIVSESDNLSYQHTHLTVPQEVEQTKEGDWYIHDSHGTVGLYQAKSVTPESIITTTEDASWVIYSRKIIATTDHKIAWEDLTVCAEELLIGNALVVFHNHNIFKKTRVITSKIPQVPRAFQKEYVSSAKEVWEVEYSNYYKEGRPLDGKMLMLNPDRSVAVTLAIGGKCPKNGRELTAYITHKNKSVIAATDGGGHAYKVKDKHTNSDYLVKDRYNVNEYEFDRFLGGMDF